jgi:hypothetical protein
MVSVSNGRSCPGEGGGELFLYLGIHGRTTGMCNLFDQSNLSMRCNFHKSVING